MTAEEKELHAKLSWLEYCCEILSSSVIDKKEQIEAYISQRDAWKKTAKYAEEKCVGECTPDYIADSEFYCLLKEAEALEKI